MRAAAWTAREYFSLLQLRCGLLSLPVPSGPGPTAAALSQAAAFARTGLPGGRPPRPRQTRRATDVVHHIDRTPRPMRAGQTVEETARTRGAPPGPLPSTRHEVEG